MRVGSRADTSLPAGRNLARNQPPPVGGCCTLGVSGKAVAAACNVGENAQAT